MQTEPENKAQKIAGRVFLLVCLIISIIVWIAFYFSEGSVVANNKDFKNAGAFIVKEKLLYEGHNSYYEDTWTSQKYSNSGSKYEVYSLQSMTYTYSIITVKFNKVNFNVNDSIYLFYRDDYSYNKKDSTYYGSYADSTISIIKARQRKLLK